MFSTEAHIFDIEAGQQINFEDPTYQANVYSKQQEDLRVSNVVFESALTCKSQPWWERAELIFNAPGIKAGKFIHKGSGLGKKFLDNLNGGKHPSKNDFNGIAKNTVLDGTSNGGKAMHLEIPDLGSFDVEAFPGGFQIFNHNDNLFIDIANLGGEPVMISEGYHFDDVDTRNSETFGKIATWFHYNDGTSRQCYLESGATNHYYSCSPSAFGEFAIQPFHITGVLVQPKGDPEGCNDFVDPEQIRGKIVLLLRGGCLFEEKALYAQKAGAIGVVIGLINKNDKLFIMAGIQDSTGISPTESLTMEGDNLDSSAHTLSEEEVKDYDRDLAKVKSLISFGTDSNENGKKKVSEGLKIMISNLVENLKSDKIPMKAKKNVVDLALQILSLDPDKPLTPKIYADIMAGIKANQIYAGRGVQKGDDGSDEPSLAAKATKIPVVQVTFQNARHLRALLTAYSDVDDRPVVTVANVLPAKVPEKIRHKNIAILKGNATYIDLITRGEWGVNLNLKENEWQLGITKRVGKIDL